MFTFDVSLYIFYGAEDTVDFGCDFARSLSLYTATDISRVLLK